MKTNCIELQGIITKIHPDNRFMVHCTAANKDSLCYLCGKLKRGPKPSVGDNVRFEVDSSNISLGRITSYR